MARLRALYPVIVALMAPLAACATAPTPTAAGQPIVASVAVPTPRAGVAHLPAEQLLLTANGLNGWTLDGAAGAQVHPGPGLSSATTRLVSGSGAQARHLYDRVSAFASVGAATAEFKQEQGDIGRSSTALPANGQTVGQSFQAYTVDSGAGATASSSAGMLIQERNYLVSIVLSGPHAAVQVADVLPYAERQVAAIATAT